jgi:hydroxymethylpyrimidine pyrophosphatase-like HAD family hydrolase
MGNADGATRDGADWITESNDADGIAVFLEEQVLPYR